MPSSVGKFGIELMNETDPVPDITPPNDVNPGAWLNVLKSIKLVTNVDGLICRLFAPKTTAELVG